MSIITIDQTKVAAAKQDACKAEAKQRLVDTDWSQQADVRSQISNAAAFDIYRASVRELYLNPVAEPVWPERPEAQWAV
jgi:hypothetical protein